jgi:transcription initiation factor TFIIB
MDSYYIEYCTNCRKNTPLAIDHYEGNITCQVCGLVTERVIDQTAEYRKFAAENDSSRGDRERIGAIRDDSRADGGLGLSVTSSSSNRMAAVQKMSTRLGPETEDLCHIKGMRMIRRWGDLLNLKKPTLMRVEEQFTKVESKKKNFKGRSLESVMAALLYITSRMCSIELKPHDIESVSGVPAEEIKKAYKALKEYVDPIPALDGTRWCSNICAKMNLSHTLSATAFKIAEDIKEKRHLDGRNPRTVASVAIYIAAVNLSVQKECPLSLISDYSKIAESTIKKTYNEIFTKYAVKL